MSSPISKSARIAAVGMLLSCFTGGLLVALHAPLGTIERQTIFHFVAADSYGSERLMAHLLAQQPRESAHEIVVQIGARQPIHAELESAGYEVRFEATPAASGVETAPWLLVRESDGNVSYSGGYEPAPYWESRILFQVEHRILRAALPSTGCSTSSKLRVVNIAHHRIFKFIFAT